MMYITFVGAVRYLCFFRIWCSDADLCWDEERCWCARVLPG